jgi:hypothetical protein
LKKLLLISLISGLLLACTDETVISQVSGQLYTDCNQAAAQGVEIAFKVNPSSRSFSEPIILASTVTDQNGYFQFSYELEESEMGNADLIQVQADGVQTLIQELELQKDHQLNLYANNISTLVLTQTGNRTLGPQDTLFVQLSYNGQEYFYVQAAKGVFDTLYLAVPNPKTNGTNTWINYGVGRQDLLKSIEASNIQDSAYKNVFKRLEGCSEQEEASLWVN